MSVLKLRFVHYLTAACRNDFGMFASKKGRFLKGVWHEIFDFRFFHLSLSPGPPSIPLGPFEFFRKFAEIFENAISCSPVSTTLAINLSPVSMTPPNNPCHGFSVIPVSLIPAINFSPVTMATNLSLVTRTRMPWRWGAAKDRRKLKGKNRWYLRPQKSNTAADGVIVTAMKSCIHRHPTNPDQRPLRPPKLNIVVLVGSSFGGLRGLLSKICGVPMDATFHGGSNDTMGGRVRLPRPEISLICPDLQKEQISVVNIAYHRWKIYRCRWHQVTVYRWCHWHQRTICWRCHWHRK